MKKINKYLSDNFSTVITFVFLCFVYYLFLPYDFLYDFKSNFFPYGKKFITQQYYPQKVLRIVLFVISSFIPYFLIQIFYSLFVKFTNKSSFKLVKLNNFFLIIPIILCSVSLYGLMIMKDDFIKSTLEFRKRTKEIINSIDPLE